MSKRNVKENIFSIKENEVQEVKDVLDNLEVQGYRYCDSHKQRCLNDCWFLHNSVASDVE